MSDLYNEISEALLEVIEDLDEKKRKKKKKKKKKKKGGKKDACYHKVKSRYKVWPSAYASGALVKCRKVGASNWGNKSKKNESLDRLDQIIEEELQAALKEAIDMNSPDMILITRRNELSNEDIFVLVGNRLMKMYRDKVSYEVFLMDMKRKPGKLGSVSSKEFAELWQNFNQNRSEYTPEFMIDGRQIVPKDTLQEKKKKRKKRKKAGTESSKESSLRDWFGRKGAKGKRKGWVDCNAPDGKGGYKSCGRSSGEGRKKYPACRPTPGACKERGKGKSWGKKSSKKKK
jgi:hypothetical protein